MGRLILVGVVHRDPEGGRYLSQTLQEIRPQAVGLELSPLGLLWRETRSRELLDKLDELLEEFPASAIAHADIRFIVEALRLPFEFLACADYASRQNIPLHLMDLNWVSREELPKYQEEIVKKGNLATLLSRSQAPLEKKILVAYARARGCLNSGRSLQEIGIKPPWSSKRGLLREMFLACRVRNMAGRYEVFLYVGGWIHLVEDPRGLSLARLLKDLQPLKILLRGPESAATTSSPSI